MKNIKISANKVKGINDRFWEAAGLDELFPLAHTESGDYILKKMGNNKGIRYVRNHYTLSSCTRYNLRCGGEVYTEDES